MFLEVTKYGRHDLTNKMRKRYSKIGRYLIMTGRVMLSEWCRKRNEKMMFRYSNLLFHNLWIDDQWALSWYDSSWIRSKSTSRRQVTWGTLHELTSCESHPHDTKVRSINTSSMQSGATNERFTILGKNNCIRNHPWFWIYACERNHKITIHLISEMR